MKGHNRDLPTMRLRRASYTLLSVMRETAREVEGDLSRIRQAGSDKTNKTFEWKRTYRGFWWLQIN